MNLADVGTSRTRWCFSGLLAGRLVDLEAYLEEDIGSGDATADLFRREKGKAHMVLRERAFVAGLQHAKGVFERHGCEVLGDTSPRWADAGEVLLDVHGPVAGIVSAERLALNIVGRMSGIATKTRLLVEELARACSASRVAGTRKTTPGFRRFEKEAIAAAGGEPHRKGLYDEMMVKDNHIAVVGDVAEATKRAHAAHPDMVLTVEVERLEDALAAAKAGADWIMIDNQDADTGHAWAEAVWEEHPEVKIEASGGITAKNMLAYGWADRISMGSLTTDARWTDVGLDWEEA